MSQEMLKRAERIKARNRQLETFQGTGYHDNDKDTHGRPRCPQKIRNELGYRPEQTFCRVSENLVLFFGDRQLHLVGSDAGKALAALQSFHQRAKSKSDEGGDLTGTERKCLQYVPRLAVVKVEEVDRLNLWRDEWNDLLFALTTESIGLTGLPANSPLVIEGESY